MQLPKEGSIMHMTCIDAFCRQQKENAVVALSESVRLFPCNWAAWQVPVHPSVHLCRFSKYSCIVLPTAAEHASAELRQLPDWLRPVLGDTQCNTS